MCTVIVCVLTPLQPNNLLTKKARGPEGAGAAPASIMETNVCKASVFYSNRNSRQQASVRQTLPIFLAFSFVGFVKDFLVLFFGFFWGCCFFFFNFFTV